MHKYEDLISIFNACFSTTHNTQLVKGTEEPLYVPTNPEQPYNAIFFARGFFASALHECSHWLIAGEKRRTLVDFGYWYVPDGRTNIEQELFQSVEIKPQALEWILSNACGYRFYTSVDNLNGKETDSLSFKLAVHNQIKTYCEHGLPSRAKKFRTALCDFYKTNYELNFKDFDINTIL